jgi:hypothetical protein
MTYQLTTFDATGRKTGNLGKFASVIAARNAMIEHAGWEPTELPFHCPDLGIEEGWFIGSTEYNIEFRVAA